MSLHRPLGLVQSTDSQVDLLGAVCAMTGVFVAGMDAGHAYNDFPYMNGQWVPDEYWAVQGWRGFFENTAAVQLHHRLLASTTLISVLTTWAMFRGKVLPHASRQLLNGLAAVTALQVRYWMTHVFLSLVNMTHSAVFAWMTTAMSITALLP